MTRILTITSWYPPHHFGGYELSCFDVTRGLQRRGHDVTVLTSDTRVPGAMAGDGDHEGRVRRELRLYHRDGTLWSPSLRTRLAIERHNQAALRRALDEVQPDVVSAWHFGVLSLGLLTTLAEAGVPVVYSICDDWLLYGRKLDAWARLFVGSPVRRAAGRILRPVLGVPTTVADLGRSGAALFITETVRRLAQTNGPWPFDESTVVYNGIDRATFPPRPADPDRPWRWQLAILGRPDRRKGFETAIRALPLLPPEATLVHNGLGGDEERERLRGIATELGVGDRVTFAASPRAELPNVYGAADVLLFPTEWEEPFGLVPIEAMACATPVVASLLGGSREIFFDEVNVLEYPPGDAVALAAAVHRLHDDPELRAGLVARGLETADELTAERLVDAMEAWHDHAAGKAPRPADRPPPVDPGGVAVPAATPAAPTDGDRRTVRVPLTTDVRLLPRRFRRWWRGDRAPVAPAGAVGSLAEAVAAAGADPGWRVVDARPVPWTSGKLGRLAPLAARYDAVARRVPEVEVVLERVDAGAPPGAGASGGAV